MSLYISCLANDCDSRGITYWFHSNDGHLLATNQPTNICGTLKISTQARIKCDGCGAVSRFDSWKFKCSNQHDYGNTSFNSFASASNIVGDPNDFVRDLLEYL